MRKLLDILAWRMRYLVNGHADIRSDIEEKVLSCYNPYTQRFDIHLEDGTTYKLDERDFKEFVNEAVIRYSGVFHRHSFRKKQRQRSP